MSLGEIDNLQSGQANPPLSKGEIQDTPKATSARFVWVNRLSEDWWSVILGLVLLTLIISRLLTAIP